VQVTIASGSSAGVHMGVIVSGSGKVFSAWGRLWAMVWLLKKLLDFLKPN